MYESLKGKQVPFEWYGEWKDFKNFVVRQLLKINKNSNQEKTIDRNFSISMSTVLFQEHLLNARDICTVKKKILSTVV